SQASDADVASGFSTSTFTPDLSATSAMAKWVECGVAIITPSSSSVSSISETSLYPLAPTSSAALLAREWLGSQIARRSASGFVATAGMWTVVAHHPAPTTAIRALPLMRYPPESRGSLAGRSARPDFGQVRSQ